MIISIFLDPFLSEVVLVDLSDKEVAQAESPNVGILGSRKVLHSKEVLSFKG